ncbi:hypothetical protein DASC09_023040 [Saccharomycopsis crataegensis]|uniref:Transcription factor CBF/NF-Y/archaeal histone domain-containing protein n=1 Tax=Saccharomycopsis crataegensis TaxID=43959 RepID=A0AAV5QKM3_9ASCO|nr:hypothetical protein DASC09_023040 [Saccharomycopsis crataegensis]
MGNSKVVKPLARSRFKKIIKSKLQKQKSLKNDSTDLLVYLNYMLFLKTLLNEAQALQSKEDSEELTVVHLNNIRSSVLKRFRG